MTQKHSDNQPSPGKNVGKEVGMSDLFIPTSFPHSMPKVGTAVPTFIPTVQLPSRAVLAARRPTAFTCTLALLIVLVGAALALDVYREAQAKEAPHNTLPPTLEKDVRH